MSFSIFDSTALVRAGGGVRASHVRRAALILAWPAMGIAQSDEPAPREASGVTATLARVEIIGTRPATMPTEIPTTTRSITAKQIERAINATDSEDALKYFPSLNVRKRYIGDHDHAVLASRASGTGNSARSLVYADGILLSNLLGNGAAYTPRWGLVTPEEIDRVDVLYGPFSAAYSGNSAGAVVDFTTRMPTQFEAHMKLQGFTQKFQLHHIDERFSGGAGSASVGSREGAVSWWVNVNHLDSYGQPIVFANRLVSAGVAGTVNAPTTGVPVTGAVADTNPGNKNWLILGDTGRTHTVQDHAKLKLAFDFLPTLRMSYTLGYWTNTAERNVSSYLRDAAGIPVYGSTANPKITVGERDYTLAPSDFAASRGQLEHLTHALGVKSNTGDTWDWEAAASLYDYRRDEVRSPTTFMPNASAGGAGRITDLSGSGWNTLAFKGIWRSDGARGAHIVEAGLQRDAFKLRTRVSNTSDWLSGDAGSRFSAFNGNTTLQSAWVQDAWRFSQAWKAVLGARIEHWQAFNGSIADATANAPLTFMSRSETNVSPKAALSFAPDDDWTLKASVGRAVRMPTVAELYQGSVSAGIIVNNDPNLKPEKSWTSELTAERSIGNGLLRATVFHEATADALYSQTNVSVTPTVINIQNIDAMRTTGLELAFGASDIAVKGLDLNGSLTFADSIITKNDKFPASVGHWQPRVPRWRAHVLATWKPTDLWALTAGARYSGTQYGTLDNSDPNGGAYTGVSRFIAADVRVLYRVTRQWSVALGIDNLNNATYWAFHPYPQRTFSAELRFDL